MSHREKTRFGQILKWPSTLSDQFCIMKQWLFVQKRHVLHFQTPYWSATRGVFFGKIQFFHEKNDPDFHLTAGEQLNSRPNLRAGMKPQREQGSKPAPARLG